MDKVARLRGTMIHRSVLHIAGKWLGVYDDFEATLRDEAMWMAAALTDALKADDGAWISALVDPGGPHWNAFLGDYRSLPPTVRSAVYAPIDVPVKAAVAALQKYPILNASVDGNHIVYHGYIDIGVAVGSPRGLVVPILRNVDQMSFADIEKKIAEFGEKAKDGKLSMEDLAGGTFSISNGGVFGSMLSTPIINPPQSAILGIHATKDRPVVENGQIVIRPINYLALSYDHRIIDGREAVLGLVAMKDALEDPARLLLGV